MRIALLFVLAVATRVLPAQRVTGTVRTVADSTPLVGAVVGMAGGSYTHTDSGGIFRFGRLTLGRHEVRIRRLGFEPFARYLEVTADGPNDFTVWMTPLPVRLVEVSVSGKRVSVPYRFEEVYRRAASGFGHLITLEDIERRQPFNIREMLDGISGIQVQPQRVLFRRCGGGNDYTFRIEPSKVQVYVDGRRVTKFQGGVTGTNVDEALSHINTASVQAIEVYVGIAEIPAEFSVDACAVIAVWTRRY